jgi:hypothetical protein
MPQRNGSSLLSSLQLVASDTFLPSLLRLRVKLHQTLVVQGCFIQLGVRTVLQLLGTCLLSSVYIVYFVARCALRAVLFGLFVDMCAFECLSACDLMLYMHKKLSVRTRW